MKKTSLLKKPLCAMAIATAAFFGATGVQYTISTPVASAGYGPVTIDYGNGNYWVVMKNTLMASGRIGSTVLSVTVHRGNSSEYREYKFTKSTGYWRYCYRVGNGNYTDWHRVSGNKLANDILYIITN